MNREKLRKEIRESAQLSFSRSGGPGGQNVNKRDTKVTVRLDVTRLTEAGAEGITHIRTRLSNRMNGDGFVVIQVDNERSQAQNREIALERLERLVVEALRPDPKPRRPSKPSRAAKERRLSAKKCRAAVKSRRSKIVQNDE